jgi:hypothetical protein
MLVAALRTRCRRIRPARWSLTLRQAQGDTAHARHFLPTHHEVLTRNVRGDTRGIGAAPIVAGGVVRGGAAGTRERAEAWKAGSARTVATGAQDARRERARRTPAHHPANHHREATRPPVSPRPASISTRIDLRLPSPIVHQPRRRRTSSRCRSTGEPLAAHPSSLPPTCSHHTERARAAQGVRRILGRSSTRILRYPPRLT